MKKIIIILAIQFTLISISYSAELKSINFNQRGETSSLELSLDNSSVSVSKFHVTEDKQIIIDLSDVSASERVIRSFDTSEFSGSVVFVSAYRKPGNLKDLRIAIQLRENVRSILKRINDKLVLDVENRYGVFSQMQVEEDIAYDAKTGKPTALELGEEMKVVKKQSEEESKGEGRIHIPKSDSVLDILENLTLSGKKRYIGKRITLTVNGVPVEDILKLIAESSGFNIILSEEVKRSPPLTLNLANTPWDQVLDTIMDINKLVATKNGNILIVNTFERAAQEKEAEQKAKLSLKEEEPLLTKVFKISYASLGELGPTVSKYITVGRGSISPDERTNSLIVKDTAEVLDRIKKIIEVLDYQTPQVLIEAKIVEVIERYSKEIGLKRGVSFGYDPVANMDSVTDSGPGFSFSSAPDGTNNFIGLSIASFNRLRNLDLTLQLLETESKGKVISSPKVITQNKKPATITTGDSRSFLITSTANGVTTSSYTEISADLSLNVTPQVTNEGSILMEVSLTKSQFGAQADRSTPPPVASRSVQTNVLVDNGSTIVIGGIYAFSKSESHSGIPFLKDIPLVGWLFRTPYNPVIDKNEMMIFLTPRIINQKEAGLSDQG